MLERGHACDLSNSAGSSAHSQPENSPPCAKSCGGTSGAEACRSTQALSALAFQGLGPRRAPQVF